MPMTSSVGVTKGAQFSAATTAYANSIALQRGTTSGPIVSAVRQQSSRVTQRKGSRPPLPQLDPHQAAITASTASRGIGGSRGFRERARSTDCVNGVGTLATRQPLTQLGQSGQANGSNVATSAGRRGSLSLQERGLVGLNNLGNTCYMNSILQCLSHTRPLLELLLRSSAELSREASVGRLATTYKRLMREMWSSGAPVCVSPSDLRSGVARLAPRFRSSGQQDAQEFLRYLLEGLHDDLSRSKDKRPRLPPIDYQQLDRLPDPEKADKLWNRYLTLEDSPIVDIFVGQLKSTLKCCHCDTKSTTFDPFWDLALPIPRGSRTTLADCLDLFTRQETLDGNERPKCDKCKARRPCEKSFSLYRLPKILVIHLMRFSGERFKTKLNTLVEYPLQLDLSPYVDSERRSLPQCTRYSLYAVSQHSGTPYGGHYTAMVRHAYATERWVNFNDSMVSSGSAQLAVSPQGYVLFYEMNSSS